MDNCPPHLMLHSSIYISHATDTAATNTRHADYHPCQPKCSRSTGLFCIFSLRDYLLLPTVWCRCLGEIKRGKCTKKQKEEEKKKQPDSKEKKMKEVI